MLDRESTFADPRIVKLLQTRFVPVAIDQAYQRRQRDAEGDFYRKIVTQASWTPERGTSQGLYAAGADGSLLGSTNNRGSQRVLKMLDRALQAHQPAEAKAIAPGKLDPRYNPRPPKGGLVVRVHSKVLDGYEETDNEFRRIFQQSIGRDNLWVRPDEHRALLRGEMPRSLLTRLARYHLVDNTRGEPPMWQKDDLRELEFTFVDGRLEATVELSNSGRDRAYEAQLVGVIRSNAERVTEFQLAAKGRFRGEGRYTRGAPKGWFPFAVIFNLADGSDLADSIPPQGSRGWVDGYLRMR